MLLFSGMAQDFEKTLKDFISQVDGFVQHMHDGLSALLESSASSEVDHSISKPVAKKTANVPAQKLDQISQKKILIVDDAEINRILMGHFFKNVPVKLEFAASGEQAVEKATQQIFDLILMDLQMKGMSGVEAIKTIRSAQQAKTTRIVAISNQAPNEQEQSEAISSGANEYLTKSMSRDDMREKVFALLLSA